MPTARASAILYNKFFLSSAALVVSIKRITCRLPCYFAPYFTSESHEYIILLDSREKKRFLTVNINSKKENAKNK